MSIINSILSYFENKDTQQAPEGLCPNCWGRQEYEGETYEFLQSHQINLNNLTEKKAFIQDFVTKKIDGITLQRKGEKFMCTSCSVSYDAN